MVSGNKAGLFNIMLASLAGGASAFAIFAMPQELMAGSIEDIGLAELMASPIDFTARLGVMAAAATCASLLAWLALRSCDPPRAKPATPIDDSIEEDWLTQRLASRSGPPTPQPFYAEQELVLDNPFVELARGAEPIEGPLELRTDQITDEPAVAANDDDEGLSATELLARMQPPVPEAGVADLIQQLNAGLVHGEWPLPSGEQEDTPDVDRLRNVLRDLQGRPRGA